MVYIKICCKILLRKNVAKILDHKGGGVGKFFQGGGLDQQGGSFVRGGGKGFPPPKAVEIFRIRLSLNKNV